MFLKARSVPCGKTIRHADAICRSQPPALRRNLGASKTLDLVVDSEPSITRIR
jgi:hypothetical protein